MATPQSAMRTHIDLAKAAIVSGDYVTAKRELLLAQFELAKIPDTEDFDGISTKQRGISELNGLRKAIDDVEADATSSRKPSRHIARPC